MEWNQSFVLLKISPINFMETLPAQNSFSMALAQLTDLPAIADFEQKYFDVGQPYSLEEYENVFRNGDIYRLLDSSNVLVGVAAQTYGPASHSRLSIGDSEAYLAGIVIHPDFRAQGLARQLLEQCEQAAILRKMQRMITCIRAKNLPSLKAFSKAGFIVSNGLLNVMAPDEKTNDEGGRCILVKELNCPSVSLEQPEDAVYAFYSKF